MLRPCRHVEETYLYCLGEAIARFELTLHGYLAMSNHQHLIVRDNRGNYPAFLAHFHKMLAKALNAHHGRWENFWATEQPNAVYLVEKSDRFDKLIYLLANPVAAHLVERVADWPGACSLGFHLNERIRVVKRPRGFFRAGGPMPDEVVLRVERLDGFEELSEQEWSEMVATAVRNEEERARQERLEKGLRVVGRKAVLRTAPTERPRTIAPRQRLRPHLACRNVERRVMELRALREFRIKHRDALTRWCAGDRQVPFPLGTYRMRAFGIRLEAPVRSQSHEAVGTMNA